jgi:ATP-dependent Clp protease ATP-binding subunit ClpC
MFERYTERARQVVVLAQDEARAFNHNYIGTEHILLGLLREEEGLACQVLESLDIKIEEVRAQVARIVGQGHETSTGQIPFTPRGKKVLELAMREALSLGHNYIGTEHILLGLARENEGVAARISLDFDVDAEKIRNAVLRMLPGFESRRRVDTASGRARSPDHPGASSSPDAAQGTAPREQNCARRGGRQCLSPRCMDRSARRRRCRLPDWRPGRLADLGLRRTR